jgi:hypothetical protein
MEERREGGTHLRCGWKKERKERECLTQHPKVIVAGEGGVKWEILKLLVGIVGAIIQCIEDVRAREK